MQAIGTPVNNMPYKLRVIRGLIKGVEFDTKFGSVKLVDAADSPKDVWAYADDNISGGDTKTFPTTASVFYAASSSASDSGKVFSWEGKAADGTRRVNTFTCAGQTPVAIDGANLSLDVNRCYLDDDNETMVGGLTIVTANNFTAGVPDDPAEVVSYVSENYAQTQLGMYNVPEGETIVITALRAYMTRANGSLGSGEVNFRIKAPNGSWRVVRPYEASTSSPTSSDSSIVLEGGSLIVPRLQDVSDADTTVNTEIDYYTFYTGARSS